MILASRVHPPEKNKYPGLPKLYKVFYLNQSGTLCAGIQSNILQQARSDGKEGGIFRKAGIFMTIFFLYSRERI